MLAPEATEVAVAPRLRLAVMRIARILRQNVDTGSDLPTTLLSVLGTVDRLGPVTLGDLAGAEGVQPPSMTRLVARLEARGLVRREIDAHDRRVARVQLTDEGRRLLSRSRTRRTAFLAQRLRALTPGDLAALEAALPVLERLAGESR